MALTHEWTSVLPAPKLTLEPFRRFEAARPCSAYAGSLASVVNKAESAAHTLRGRLDTHVGGKSASGCECPVRPLVSSIHDRMHFAKRTSNLKRRSFQGETYPQRAPFAGSRLVWQSATAAQVLVHASDLPLGSGVRSGGDRLRRGSGQEAGRATLAKFSS